MEKQANNEIASNYYNVSPTVSLTPRPPYPRIVKGLAPQTRRRIVKTIEAGLYSQIVRSGKQLVTN